MSRDRDLPKKCRIKVESSFFFFDEGICGATKGLLSKILIFKLDEINLAEFWINFFRNEIVLIYFLKINFEKILARLFRSLFVRFFPNFAFGCFYIVLMEKNV